MECILIKKKNYGMPIYIMYSQKSSIIHVIYVIRIVLPLACCVIRCFYQMKINYFYSQC